MQRKHTLVTLILLGALPFQAASAAESVYYGDCERARIVAEQNSIDKLITRRKYEGTQRGLFQVYKSATCDRDAFIIYTLTERSRTTSALIFDMARTEIMYGKQNGCPPLALSPDVYTGTITFTTKFEQKGDVCDFYIWSNWDQEVKAIDWKHTFASRLVTLGGDAFVIEQTASTNGTFVTPLAFTGVD